ncbi:hypothetical protein [Bifidobacterium aemilianum]|nr:hypothetical protein [Bifidobacterium aemilianum]
MTHSEPPVDPPNLEAIEAAIEYLQATWDKQEEDEVAIWKGETL